MALYMSLRIIEGAYTYAYVCQRSPDLQPAIETHLRDAGREDLIHE